MFDDFAQTVVGAVGGSRNIARLTHCATRLRFQLVDSTKVDLDTIGSRPEAVGVFEAQGQLQVVIGTNVAEVYQAFVAIPGVRTGDKDAEGAGSDSAEATSSGGSGSVIDRVLGTVSAIFTPYIPVLASVGIIKGVLALLVKANLLSDTSSTYAIMTATGNALIYFFPILLAFTAAKQFGANPYVGATIGAALLEPNLTAVNVTGEDSSFLGIPFIGQSFENTVIPILIGMWAFSYLEKGLKKLLPQITHLLLVPVICMAVMVPAILLVFGPVGFGIAKGIGYGYDFLVQYPIIMSAIFGALFIYVIMIGAHWVVLPLQLQILATDGKEYSLAAGGMGNYALLGVLLAVFWMKRDKATRAVSGSAAFVNALSGITEPGMFGVVVKSKRYFIALTTGGLVGGIICGIFGCYITNFAFTGLIGLPAFASSPTAVGYFIAVAATIVSAFLVTVALEKGLRRPSTKAAASESPASEAPATV